MATGSRRASGGRMGVIVRLRRWLLLGIAVLVVILAGLLGYARYRARKLITDIPKRLGLDIKSETNNFVVSRAVKGHTVFTLRASKAIQRQDNKTTLHNAEITLFGPVGSNRQDKISGAEFEYDQANGVVTAKGEVHLDLATPAPDGTAPKPDAKRIEVTTSGLVFLQKLGVAATDQPIHIVYGDLKGEATGADYESDTGLLQLHSAVRMDGTQDGQVVHMHAAAAVLDRNQQIATLTRGHVLAGENQTSGDTMVLNVSKGGVIQHAHAQGHAALEGDHGMHAESDRMDATFNTAGKLELLNMNGGVRLHGTGGSGSSADAVVRFDAAGKPQQVDLSHAVQLQGEGATRGTLTADHVTAMLVQDAQQHSVLHDATATGGAVLRTTETVAVAGKTVHRTNTVTAPTLHAVMAQAGAARYVQTLDGSGGTRVDQTDDAGNVRTSTGDTLHATLRPPLPKGAPASPNQGANQGAIQTAVQTGHVVVTQHDVAVAGKAAQDSRATAGRAEFDSATGRMVLTGQPQVTGQGVQMAADRIAMSQAGGDAQGDGNVRGTLIQTDAKGNAGDPVHVLADHATVSGSGTLSHFFGGAKAVRMWSSTAQMDAPQIDLDRPKGQLIGISDGRAGSVHLTLPSASNSSNEPKSNSSTNAAPVRFTGDGLTVTQAVGQTPGHAVMTGGVHLLTGETQMTADTVDATLAAGGARGAGTMGGSVQSVLATGAVHLQQPGRTGTGTRLLYTAADGRYELTGTPAAPPRILDSQRGTVTGTTLIFHGADDSVEVQGDSGHRVRTETQAARPASSR